MKGVKSVTVMFTAAWGDGSVSSMNGIAHEDDFKILETLAERFPELISVLASAEPVSVDIVDYTRWWICGGDNDILEKVYDLNAEEFATAVRRDVAPIGYK